MAETRVDDKSKKKRGTGVQVQQSVPMPLQDSAGNTDSGVNANAGVVQQPVVQQPVEQVSQSLNVDEADPTRSMQAQGVAEASKVLEQVPDSDAQISQSFGSPNEGGEVSQDKNSAGSDVNIQKSDAGEVDLEADPNEQLMRAGVAVNGRQALLRNVVVEPNGLDGVLARLKSMSDNFAKQAEQYKGAITGLRVKAGSDSAERLSSKADESVAAVEQVSADRQAVLVGDAGKTQAEKQLEADKAAAAEVARVNAIDWSRTDVQATKQDAADAMKQRFPDSNVDLFNRPRVSGEDMREAGWGQCTGDYATVFSSEYEIDGKRVMVTPIYTDAKGNVHVMSPQELSDYVGRLRYGDVSSDVNGCVISWDSKPGDGAALSRMQDVYYITSAPKVVATDGVEESNEAQSVAGADGVVSQQTPTDKDNISDSTLKATRQVTNGKTDITPDQQHATQSLGKKRLDGFGSTSTSSSETETTESGKTREYDAVWKVDMEGGKRANEVIEREKKARDARRARIEELDKQIAEAKTDEEREKLSGEKAELEREEYTYNMANEGVSVTWEKLPDGSYTYILDYSEADREVLDNINKKYYDTINGINDHIRAYKAALQNAHDTKNLPEVLKYNSLVKEQEERLKEMESPKGRRAFRARRLIAVFGDVLSHMANMWGAMHGALPLDIKSGTAAVNADEARQQALQQKRVEQYNKLIQRARKDADKAIAALNKADEDSLREYSKALFAAAAKGNKAELEAFKENQRLRNERDKERMKADRKRVEEQNRFEDKSKLAKQQHEYKTQQQAQKTRDAKSVASHKEAEKRKTKRTPSAGSSGGNSGGGKSSSSSKSPSVTDNKNAAKVNHAATLESEADKNK